MWTATIKEKGTNEQGTFVDVTFTDGVTTKTERCIPQDIVGFKHWVAGRLATFNCKTDLDAKYQINDEVKLAEPVVQPTADELATRAWFADFRKMQEVDKLIDIGVFTGTEAPIVTLKNKLKTNFKVGYLDLM
jgi:hypothetical protein